MSHTAENVQNILEGREPEENAPKPAPVQIKMNRKARRSMGRARMPWSKQVDSFLCLLNHNKYVKKKEGMKE